MSRLEESGVPDASFSSEDRSQLYFSAGLYAPGEQQLCWILLFKHFVSLFIFFLVSPSGSPFRCMLVPLASRIAQGDELGAL